MRQFVADASHELRTPLTAIRGYAEYYRQRGGCTTARASVASRATTWQQRQLTRADLDRIMQRVEQESARMGVLVEDMLLLARLDQQRPLEQPAGGPAHAGRRRGAGRPDDRPGPEHQPDRRARRRVPDRLGDEVRLRQVIGNLMSNALYPHARRARRSTVADRWPRGRGRRRLAGVPSVGGAPGGRRPGPGPAPGAGRARLRAVLPRRPGPDQAGRRHRPRAWPSWPRWSPRTAAPSRWRPTPGGGATFRITLPLAPEARSISWTSATRRPGQPGRGRDRPGRRRGRTPDGVR